MGGGLASAPWAPQAIPPPSPGACRLLAALGNLNLDWSRQLTGAMAFSGWVVCEARGARVVRCPGSLPPLPGPPDIAFVR